MVGARFNVSANALDVLQGASEEHVEELMDKAATVAAYGSRSTVYANDLVLVQQLLLKR
jgi:histone H3/H4